LEIKARLARGPKVPLESIRPGHVMVALVTGQSNAGNYGPEDAFPEHAGVFNFFSGALYLAKNPMPGSDWTGSTPWIPLGRMLIERAGYSGVVFALAVRGGTPVKEWLPGRPLQKLVIQTGHGLQDVHLAPTHILWEQGEADGRSSAGTDPKLYADAFHAFLKSVRAAGIDAPVYVALASRTASAGPDAGIRQAQQSLVNPGDKVFAGPDADQLGPEFRRDGVHFNRTGLQRLAELWFASLAEQH